MSASSWLSLLAICVLGAISPGPSLAAVMKNTLQGSKQHGMVTAISHAAGIGIYAFLVAAGMALVITGTPWLFKTMTWGGAAYLAWLGYKSLTAPASFLTAGNADKNTPTARQAAIDGFLISFLNPKIAVFFLALFSQFVSEETTLGTQLLMALMATVCDGVWYCMIAGVAGHSKVLPTLRRKASLVNKLCGLLLIGVALRILTL